LSSIPSKIRVDFLRLAWPRNWAAPGKTYNRSTPWIASLQRQNVVEVVGFQEERKIRVSQIAFSPPFNIQNSKLPSAAQQHEHAESSEQGCGGFRDDGEP
jgi:hypothetical protein